MKNIILLHGALGSKTELFPLGEALSTKFKVHYMEFEGHGSTPLNTEFSISAFANNLRSYILENQLEGADIFGYSMGGYVALYLSAENAKLMGKIVTLGTKFLWNPEAAEIEVKKLNPDIIENKVPKFAAYLSGLHGAEQWKILMRQTADLMLNLGTNELLESRFSKIKNTCFIGRGALDEMITLEETIDAISSIQNATFFSLADTAHPISRVDVSLLATQIEENLN